MEWNKIFLEMHIVAYYIFTIVLFDVSVVFGAQEPTVVINQGTVLGVKIYPESSRIPIDAFLGIPYAAPPVGRLRFAPPEKHKGWSRTLFAQQFAPGCLSMQARKQPKATQSSQPPPPSRQYTEDCLYLNIWVPDNGENRERLPVVITFLGEWSKAPPCDIPGQDLAAEGLVVVTVSYRVDILGFLCLGSQEARGNLGLLDQYYSMLWVKENIERFRGDPEKVTLMGHSAGAVSILYHMTSPRTNALFSQAILMSGNMGVFWKEMDTIKSSRALTSFLGCLRDSPKDSVQCLREKSAEEIYQVIMTQSQMSNWTSAMLPVNDNFLTKNDQYLPIKPYEALTSGNFHQIPVIIGLTNLEASDSMEQWQDLARQGYNQIYHYVEHTAIPDVMSQYGVDSQSNYRQIKEIIKWNYNMEKSAEGEPWSMLKGLVALYSDTLYEAPHSKLLSFLMKTSKPLYVYKYQQTGGVDLLGTLVNSTGATHTSDLPYLFGPTLYQQLTRRRLSQQDDRLSRRFKVMWADFIKFGYPTSPLQYNAWQVYKSSNKFILTIGSSSKEASISEEKGALFWNQLIPHLMNVTSDREGRSAFKVSPSDDDSNETIKHAMYTLLGLVLALAVLLVICLVLLKRLSKERRLSRDFGTF